MLGDLVVTPPVKRRRKLFKVPVSEVIYGHATVRAFDAKEAHDLVENEFAEKTFDIGEIPARPQDKRVMGIEFYDYSYIETDSDLDEIVEVKP